VLTVVLNCFTPAVPNLGLYYRNHGFPPFDTTGGSGINIVRASIENKWVTTDLSWACESADGAADGHLTLTFNGVIAYQQTNIRLSFTDIPNLLSSIQFGHAGLCGALTNIVYTDGLDVPTLTLTPASQIAARATLRVSRNWGQTFGNDRITSLGKEGEWNTRVVYDRLGSGRQVVLELEVSDPTPVAINDAFGDITVGQD
jgi:hypothetical protein